MPITNQLDLRYTRCCGGLIGSILSLEGIAIAPAFHGCKLGRKAVGDMVAATNAEAIAAVTRNPALVRLLGSVCERIFPDIAAQQSLAHPGRTMMHIGKVYARHIGSSLRDLPFVKDRYPVGGLYQNDPGEDMPFDEIRQNNRHGLIIVGLTKKERK